jgi:peroxiredoxin
VFFRKKNTSSKRRALSVVFQIIFFLVLFLVVRSWTQRDMIAGSAPDIIASDLRGEQVSLADYRGEPVLLYFWASWCKICEFEQGAVQSVSKSWPVLSVAMQSGGSGEVVKFMESKGVQWRTIADRSGDLTKRYGVAGVPALFIIDANGYIRFKEKGYTTSWGLKARMLMTRVFYSKNANEGVVGSLP